ncbi:hypothetical protein FH972_002189 [Carpinus fangiana]|uniref:Uncharacterized protein n=1 Tax=Carpinus fangiana TaxID=176857 RepID=A0A5N6QE52_9ROSI|nr:hypothetical protein FH972_002189 [Carpinus fangiana]
MSSSRSKTLTRVERAEKDAKSKPIEIVQIIKKAQVATAPTPPLLETAISDGKDAFAWRFQTSFDQVHFLTRSSQDANIQRFRLTVLNFCFGHAGVISKVLSHFFVPRRQNEIVLSQLEDILKQHIDFICLQVNELKQSIGELQHQVANVEATVQSLLSSQEKSDDEDPEDSE